MKDARWLDHLSPWVALGSVISTGLFPPGQELLMALPLLGAAALEWRRADLERFRRLFELGALAVFLLMVFLRLELIPTVTLTLFMLSGVRLALPRELPQRRQILLMGFLLFLTTGITNADPSFLAWALAWTLVASLLFLEQSWGQSALFRRGPGPPPPLRRALVWTLGATLLAIPFFLVLPRVALGLRPFAGVGSVASLRAGFSDVLDLGLPGGPIGSSGAVMLRIRPMSDPSPRTLEMYRQTFGLLRGMALESVHGNRWNATSSEFGGSLANLGEEFGPAEEAEILFYPDPLGVIPRPYSPMAFPDLPPNLFRGAPGGALAWFLPPRRTLPARVQFLPMKTLPMLRGGTRRMRGPRRADLLQTEAIHEPVRQWSLRQVPEDLPPVQLANRLSTILQGYRYTLENPSGGSPNPLEDFLERSRAGHCEYFASALAIALRTRGVPSRVVNGFRLGAWNGAGGYFLVTQNEAHSWVEYWDATVEAWRIADPTPGSPPSSLGEGSAFGALTRWADALQFHWDRHVVRFSDEDQMAGTEWIRTRLGLLRLRLLGQGWNLALFGALLLFLAAGLYGASRRRRKAPAPNSLPSPGGLKPLKPLLRRTRKTAPPGPGETLRRWFHRLGELRPERREALQVLLREAEAVHYGDGSEERLRPLAAEEARHWKS
ncbi:MAG: DUF3488 domain-containing protein [Acidobacteria bacterium]|nr:DUF3488 domain-containing protein [Acidobacteriota bacterium]